jgi:acetolactate synthase-1/2/3 large subunit
MPTVNKPPAHAKIYHIDVDPLKEGIPLWYIGASNVVRADSALALRQINRYLNTVQIDHAAMEKRRGHYQALHDARAAELSRCEKPRADVITAEYLTARVRENLDGDALILNEAITNSKAVHNHLYMSRPGTLFTSGASSLGWNGAAAIGVKLARPQSTVVSLSGDGSYLFSAPSTVHWMARRYATPFLQIVYNNRGWRAPKLSMLALHPQGRASAAKDLDISFNPPPDYAGIAAAAGGALAQTVREPDQLEAALKSAFQAVREEKRCAVLDVWLPHL